MAVNAARCGERVVGVGGAPVAEWSTKAIPGSPPRGELRPPVCRQRPLLHPWRHGALALMRCQGWYSGAIKTRSRRSQPARRRPGSRPTNANGRKMRDQRPVESFVLGCRVRYRRWPVVKRITVRMPWSSLLKNPTPSRQVESDRTRSRNRSAIPSRLVPL